MPTLNHLFSFGLYLAMFSVCISNLRLTTTGPKVLLSGGGSPFLYELGVALVVLASLIHLFRKKIILNSKQKATLIGINLFYSSIFLNYFLGAPDVLIEFMGKGQLRLQLELWLLGSSLIVYPITRKTLHRAIAMVVIMTLINSIYVITAYFDIAKPIYTSSWRIYGKIRHSGFLDMPASIGVLSAVTISWALWAHLRKLSFALILTVSGFATIIADSRTGMVAILGIIVARIICQRRKSNWLDITTISIVIIIAIMIINSIPDSIWSGNLARIESMKSTLQVWYDNPFGIPWGEFDSYKRNIWAVSPHNFPLLSLVYGGVLSFVVVIWFHIWLFHEWIKCRAIKGDNARFRASLILILIAVTLASWFEQIIQLSSGSMVFIVTLCGLTHLNSDTTKFKGEIS